MWQNFSGRVYLLCIPCFNCLCSVLTMSLVHKKKLISQFLKYKMADRSEMARNAIQSEFWTSKMTASSHFDKKIQTKMKLRIDLKWPEMRVIWTMFEPTADWLQLGINVYTYRQLCWERGNIHCVRPLGRMHTILVYLWCQIAIPNIRYSKGPLLWRSIIFNVHYSEVRYADCVLSLFHRFTIQKVASLNVHYFEPQTNPKYHIHFGKRHTDETPVIFLVVIL